VTDVIPLKAIKIQTLCILNDYIDYRAQVKLLKTSSTKALQNEFQQKCEQIRKNDRSTAKWLRQGLQDRVTDVNKRTRLFSVSSSSIALVTLVPSVPQFRGSPTACCHTETVYSYLL
jgi:hypothetical protein